MYGYLQHHVSYCLVTYTHTSILSFIIISLPVGVTKNKLNQRRAFYLVPFFPTTQTTTLLLVVVCFFCQRQDKSRKVQEMRKNKQHPCLQISFSCAIALNKYIKTKRGLLYIYKRKTNNFLMYILHKKAKSQSERYRNIFHLVEIIVVKLRQTMIRVKLGAHMLFLLFIQTTD